MQRVDRYGMQTFFEWLSDLDILTRLWLVETYFSFEPSQYNQLFDDELQKMSASSPDAGKPWNG